MKIAAGAFLVLIIIIGLLGAQLKSAIAKEAEAKQALEQTVEINHNLNNTVVQMQQSMKNQAAVLANTRKSLNQLGSARDALVVRYEETIKADDCAGKPYTPGLFTDG